MRWTEFRNSTYRRTLHYSACTAATFPTLSPCTCVATELICPVNARNNSLKCVFVIMSSTNFYCNLSMYSQLFAFMIAKRWKNSKVVIPTHRLSSPLPPPQGNIPGTHFCPNPSGDEIYFPSRLALGPTQPPVKWYRVFAGGKVRPGRAADHSPPSSAAVMEQ